jgi:hypothetical protein
MTTKSKNALSKRSNPLKPSIAKVYEILKKSGISTLNNVVSTARSGNSTNIEMEYASVTSPPMRANNLTDLSLFFGASIKPMAQKRGIKNLTMNN